MSVLHVGRSFLSENCLLLRNFHSLQAGVLRVLVVERDALFLGYDVEIAPAEIFAVVLGISLRILHVVRQWLAQRAVNHDEVALLSRRSRVMPFYVNLTTVQFVHALPDPIERMSFPHPWMFPQKVLHVLVEQILWVQRSGATPVMRTMHSPSVSNTCIVGL